MPSPLESLAQLKKTASQRGWFRGRRLVQHGIGPLGAYAFQHFLPPALIVCLYHGDEVERSLAAIDRKLEVYRGEIVHGLSLSRQRIGELRQALSSLPLPERRKVAGLEPNRADIIVPGVLIAEALMDRIGAAEATVSDRGILFGLLSRRAERLRSIRGAGRDE